MIHLKLRFQFGSCCGKSSEQIKGKKTDGKTEGKSKREKQPLNAIITLISYHTYCTGPRINPSGGWGVPQLVIFVILTIAGHKYLEAITQPGLSPLVSTYEGEGGSA